METLWMSLVPEAEILNSYPELAEVSRSDS